MFVGRSAELSTLEENFNGSGIPVAIIYGREGIGKTELAKQFIKNKSHVYYLCRELSKDEQMCHLDKKIDQVDAKVLSGERVCFILDEVSLLIRGYKDFFEEFEKRLRGLAWTGKVMILLMSSSTVWGQRETDRDELGDFVDLVTCKIKLEELSFLEMVELFPDASTESIISAYSILGGVPEYLRYWDMTKGISDNIKKIFLVSGAPLVNEVERFLRKSFRELTYYNTILTALAEDELKLNYIFKKTGFKRAKISVYINNLIQLGIARKYKSWEPKAKDVTMKGIYGIQDPLLHFWYKFIYPHLSQLGWYDADEFYDAYVKEGLEEYVNITFEKVAMEYISLMNKYHKLPVSYDSFGTFFGKKNKISIIGSTKKEGLLVGRALWQDGRFDLADFKKLKEDCKELKEPVERYYVFCKGGFSEDVKRIADSEKLEMVDLESL